jgi:hypothetical protein
MPEYVYLGYELSPSPKEVKVTCARKSGGKRFLKRLLQKVLAFLGNSPWPVVETTKRTMVYFESSPYNNPEYQQSTLYSTKRALDRGKGRYMNDINIQDLLGPSRTPLS